MYASISIIICTRNRADSLLHTLQSIGQCDVPPNLKAELLVVDNGSSDHTREIVEQTQLPNVSVRYAYEPALGLSAARNRGLSESQGTLIVFTDDDVRPRQDWLLNLTKPLIDGDVDAVAGGSRMAPYLTRSWMAPTHLAMLGAAPLAGEHWIMTGLNMAFRRDVLEHVPGFDVEVGAGQLGFCEDTLFTIQLRNAGYRLKAVREAEVEHHFESERLSRSAWQRRMKGEGRSYAHILYHYGDYRLRSAPWRLITTSLRAAGLTLTRFATHRQDSPACESELKAWRDRAFYAYLLQCVGTPRKSSASLSRQA